MDDSSSVVGEVVEGLERPSVGRRYLPLVVLVVVGGVITWLAWLAIHGLERENLDKAYQLRLEAIDRLTDLPTSQAFSQYVQARLPRVQKRCGESATKAGISTAFPPTYNLGGVQVAHLCIEIERTAAAGADRGAHRRNEWSPFRYRVREVTPKSVEEDFAGRDLGAMPGLRFALDKAIPEARRAIAVLVTKSDEGPAGFYYLAPEERPAGAQKTTPRGYAGTVGWLTSEWNFSDQEGVDYVLVERLPGDADPAMPSASELLRDAFAELETSAGSDGEWTAFARPRPEFLAAHKGRYANGILGAGLLGTALAAFLMFRAAGREERIHRLVEVRTKALLRAREKEQQARLETNQVAAQRMEALGNLAGGIAHDFNNLLLGILGSVEMLRVDRSNEDSVKEALEIIERAAERASELTQQLTGFARRGKHQNVALAVNDLVGEAVALLRRTLGKSIQIHYQEASSPLYVQGDPTQLQQVLLNLAINARDAMPKGGRLSIEASFEQSDGEAPGWVQLSVEDEGCGMPPEVAARIFEPFFTTKARGQGTGMGLSMVYGIVRSHGGELEVESEVGRGTRIGVRLPAAAAPVQPRSMARPTPRPVMGKGRVLLIDDEQTVRTTANRILNFLGYEVVTAEDGPQAIELFTAEHESIDLVILDLIMPQMSGEECFQELRQIDPEALVLLSSGYERDGVAQRILEAGAIGFCQKPYHMVELSELLSRCLSQPEDSCVGLLAQST